MTRRETVEEKLVMGLLRAIAWPFKTLFGSISPSKSTNRSSLDYQFVASSWNDIEQLMQLSGSAHFHQAVTKADTLFDFVLKSVVSGGATMGERLKLAEGKMSKPAYNQVWEAHKLRNRLVHEADAEVMVWEAKQAIQSFKNGLIELKAL
ncbi:MAG: hypothetical protein WC773_04435 [Patescibacteria group bacterium]|jgi:hypothetical protein